MSKDQDIKKFKSTFRKSGLTVGEATGVLLEAAAEERRRRKERLYGTSDSDWFATKTFAFILLLAFVLVVAYQLA